MKIIMFESMNCLLLDRLCAACVPSVVSRPPFVTLLCIQLCLCVAFSGGYVSFSLLSIVNCSVSQTVPSLPQCCGLGFLMTSSTVES